jgi:hypothetical protein
MSCDRELLSYYVFWNKTSNGTLSGGNYTTKLEYNITNITPGTYDVRVQRLVTGNSARVYSNAITQSVEPGKPQAICYTDPCLNRNFTITCLISEKHTSSNRIDEVYWSRDGQMAMGVNFTRSADGTELYINVTAFTIGNYSCGIRLMDGTEIEGETHSVKPLGIYRLIVPALSASWCNITLLLYISQLRVEGFQYNVPNSSLSLYCSNISPLFSTVNYARVCIYK